VLRELAQLVDFAYREGKVHPNRAVEIVARHAAPTMTVAILFTDAYVPYAQLWKAPPEVGYSLAAFLAELILYRVHLLNAPQWASLHHDVRAVYPPTDTARQAIIDYYEMIHDPSAMFQRVGRALPASDVVELHRVALPALVNRLVGGPTIHAVRVDAKDDQDREYVCSWLNSLFIETWESVRSALATPAL